MQEDMNEFAALERDLTAMMPAASAPMRDATMFAAGQAAGRRAGRAWQASTAVLMLAVVGMGAAIWGRGEKTGAESRVAEQNTPVVAPASGSGAMPAAGGVLPMGDSEKDNGADVATVTPPRWALSRKSYIWLRNEVLVHGVGALPRQAETGSAPERVPEFLKETPLWQRKAVLDDRS